MTSSPLHYVRCGLDWVFLENGFEIHETSHGTGYAIHDVDGLHALLLREIATSQAPIRGQELRFVRTMLDLSQEGIGRIIGVERLAVTRMESDRDKAVSRTADHNIRMYLALREMQNDLAGRVLEVLNEIDDHNHGHVHFTPTEAGWARAA
jgi:DNA-binding transcriptional regulator YiaG